MSRRRGSSGDEARGRGGAHRGGGRLGQEHQDIDQVRPHRIHAGMFKAKHFRSQPVFTVLSMYEHAITIPHYR